jgi:hypothetical protein
MRCQEVRDRLERYKDGVLPTSLQSAVDEHLHACSGCRAAYEGIQTLTSLLQGARVPAQAPIADIVARTHNQQSMEGPMKHWSVRKWLGFGTAAFGVLAACALVLVLRTNTSSSRVVLKDDILENRKILHNASGSHACNCFTPFISYFNITNITSSSATFTWDCDYASTYQVTYGASSAKGTFFPTTTPTVPYTLHSITLTGLRANTTYHAAPSSICLSGCTRNDGGTNLRKSWLLDNLAANDWTFKTASTAVLEETGQASASAKCAISQAEVAKITARDVTITWKTNVPATSLIEYGPTSAYGVKSGVNTELVRDHDIQLFDLNPGSTYHCRAVSVDANSGKAVYSSDMSFTAPAFEERVVNREQIFNDPNPCTEWTMFSYFCYQPLKRVTIDILTLSGQTVASLESPSSALAEGWNKVRWDVSDNNGRRLKNGLYVYKMKFLTSNNNEIEVRNSSLRVTR